MSSTKYLNRNIYRLTSVLVFSICLLYALYVGLSALYVSHVAPGEPFHREFVFPAYASAAMIAVVGSATGLFILMGANGRARAVSEDGDV